jgi:hypothetical protein
MINLYSFFLKSNIDNLILKIDNGVVKLNDKQG